MTDDPMARFRTVVFADPALQERLGAIEIPDDLMIAARAMAASLGIALRDDDVRDGLRGLPTELSIWPPLGWLPGKSVRSGVTPAFDWTWFGAAPIRAPFHNDAVRQYGFRPFGMMTRFRTSLDTLVDGADDERALAPSGLIFHMSRCGSTLAAQMLAAVPEHIVISEAEPIDAVVQWAATSGASHDAQVTALRAVVAALGRNRSGAATRYFVKLDAWHALALPLFRAAFPDVPWVFIHREPHEVLVSHAREPGMHAVPGGLPPVVIGVDPASATSLHDYTAQVLGRLCGAVVEHWALGGGMLIAYPDLRAAMTSAIPLHFGFRPDQAEARAMAAAAIRDAKAPERAFVSDTAAKHENVTPLIAAAVTDRLAGPYAALNALHR